MRHIRTIALSSVVLAHLAFSTPVGAQSDAKPLPEEARERLDYTIGFWRSDTEYLDPDGNVVRKVVTEDKRIFVIEDRVVEITGLIDGGESTFRAWEYYDIDAGKYTLTSVNRNGQLWSMQGDLGGEFSWTARRTSGNGETILMRFTHVDIEKNSFTAIGELSKDDGKSWRTFSRQYMTRVLE